MAKRLSAFNYFGGKNNPLVLEWILTNLAKGKAFHMVDVFGGSGAILLNYHQCEIKTYNDLNSDIVNFFTQLRDDSDGLVKSLELTTFSREEYEKIKTIKHRNKREWARRFFVRTVQSFGNSGALQTYNSWSYTIRDSRYGVSQSTARYLSKIEKLPLLVNEVRKWQIERCDFAKIFERYDSGSTLFYCDPPYVHSTRSLHQKYKKEMTDSRHVELCQTLNAINGKYLLSGYDNELYEQHLNYKSKVHMGSIRTAGKDSVETLWSNYELKTHELF